MEVLLFRSMIASSRAEEYCFLHWGKVEDIKLGRGVRACTGAPKIQLERSRLGVCTASRQALMREMGGPTMGDSTLRQMTWLTGR